MTVLNRTVNCVTSCLLYVGRPGETSKIDYSGFVQRLPWCWTEEAAPWISQQLGLLVFHIAGMVLCIALCWCWQCLPTVGGNLLPHIVTPLDVTTVAWCCRQTQDVLHPAECPPAALKTSEWQWTASVFTTWHCTGSYSSQFTEDLCLFSLSNLVLWLFDRCNWQCVRWHCASCWISSVPCQSVLHIAAIFN